MYCINPDDDEPVMLLSNYLGFDKEQGYGVMGDVFQRELLLLDQMGKKRIQVWINSPGGNVSDGYNIYSTILKTKTPVDTYCTGMAASIAGVIFQAGRTRVMLDYAFLMYHNPYNEDGSVDDSLDTYLISLATMIANRTGKSDDQIKKIMAKTTYILADEALDNGFCDKVESSEALNTKYKVSVPQNLFLLSHRTNKESRKEYFKIANTVLDNIFNKNNLNDNTMSLQRINNRLKLHADASEDSAVEAIDQIMNRVVKAEEDKKKAEDDKKKAEDDKVKSEDDLKSLKAKLAKAEEDCTKAEDDKKALKDKIAKMEEDKKDEDDKKSKKDEDDKKDKAKNLVNDLVLRGIIPNITSDIEKWQNKAFLNFDLVKDLIDSMPLNRQAHKIEIQKLPNTPVKSLEGSVVSMRMAELRAESK